MKRFARIWKNLTIAALFAILFTLAIDLFVPLGEETASAIQAIDFAAIIVLFIDFAWNLAKAKNWLYYLKKNWLLGLSFLPFGASIRLASRLNAFKALLSRGEQAGKAVKIAAHSTRLMRIIRPLIIFTQNLEKKVLNLFKPKSNGKDRN